MTQNKNMLYNEKIIDHFQKPRNMGAMKNPTIKQRIGNQVCGDVMELSLEIKDEIIEDAKFQTFGCAAAIATSSILTELIKGKTIAQASKLKAIDIDQSIGGLPKIKKHCAVLAYQALEQALAKYKELDLK